MAIDTAAKRRNVGRMFEDGIIGLSPSSGLDTDDRINAAGEYIGLTYSGELPPEPEPETGSAQEPRRKTGIGPR